MTISALTLFLSITAPAEAGPGCARNSSLGAPPADSSGSHEPVVSPAAEAPVASPADQTPIAAPAGGPPGQCVDKALQEELLAKRKYRLTLARLFVKSLRHEITAYGGYYVSDLFEGTFDVGGRYTFHMSENFGSELAVGWSRLRTTTADAIEESSAFDLALGVRNDMIRVFGSLLWSPLYGKLRLVAASIWRYDLYFAIGPGVVVDPLSFGAGGNLGLGLRVFLSRAFALRFDLRDYIYAQELQGEQYVVNDLAFTAGVSLFLPPRN